MRKLLFILFVTVFVKMVVCSSSFAAKGAYPGANGKPFQAIQEQVTNLEISFDEKIVELWVRVGELQGAIDNNNTRDDAQDELISILGAALAELEGRVAANENAIEDLKTKDSLLTELIGALQAKTDDLQAQITSQGDQINLLILADQSFQQLIDALVARINTLEGLMAVDGQNITDLQTEVALLEQQILNAQTAIASKQDLIWDSCPSGYSIREIHPDGNVDCEYDSVATGGFTSFSVSRFVETANANAATAFESTSVTVTCPSGSKRTGGGFWLYSDIMILRNSYPYGSNSWKTTVLGSWPISLEYKSYINCIRLQ